MRILILALDGLEYELVKRWRLKNLLQEYHGIYKAQISPNFNKPHTPSSWFSFITGKSVHEHKVDSWWTYGKFLDWLRFKPPFVYIKGKRKLLERIGIKPKLYIERSKNTLFDVIKPSIPLFIPAYNEPYILHEMLADSFKKGLSEYEKTVWTIHDFRKRLFFKALCHYNWKLLMCWFDLADLLGHVFIKKGRYKLMKGYFELNSLVKKVKEMYDDIILIVSDHGMKVMPDGSGDHSYYGFWSLNVKPLFTPKKITDFYKMILEVFNHV